MKLTLKNKNMKNLFNRKSILFALCLVMVGNMAIAQDFEWINAIGSKGSDMGFSVATDKDGNSYVIGNASSDSFDFDKTTPGSKVALIGSHDIFFGKYDQEGNFLWAKIIGGNGADYGKGVATDDSGNVFITGYFNS